MRLTTLRVNGKQLRDKAPQCSKPTAGIPLLPAHGAPSFLHPARGFLLTHPSVSLPCDHFRAILSGPVKVYIIAFSIIPHVQHLFDGNMQPCDQPHSICTRNDMLCSQSKTARNLNYRQSLQTPNTLNSHGLLKLCAIVYGHPAHKSLEW